MALINKSGLVAKLQTLVDTAYETGSYLVDDVIATSLSLSTLSEINIVQVASKDSLPNLKYYNSPNGMIYYVNNIDVFAISSNLKWLSLDGRLIRQDSIYGAIWAWGGNTCGVLGDNTIVSKSSPVSQVGGGTAWRNVSVGGIHSLGICSNGTAWAWGCNGNGTLGDNTIVAKSSPVSVVGGFTDWCQVSAGTRHSLGVRTNGTAWGWGYGFNGQLGDGVTALNKSSPVSVVGGFTDWCQVSAGGSHSLGVRTNGTAWGWGNGVCGRVGNCVGGTSNNIPSPVSVVGGFTDWCQVSAGFCHSLGVRSNGTAWAWGFGYTGQLGDGTSFANAKRSSPTLVVGGFTDWCQVSAGGSHSLGVRTNGTAWAWGCTSYGRLGDNTQVDKSSPVSVVGGFTDWCQVSAGYRHSLGVRTNGTAWAWGCNLRGQLGDNTIVSRSSPASVVGGFTDWCQVSAGQFHSLGVRSA